MQTWKEKINALNTSGMTFAAIARSVGLSPQAISDIRHGRTTEPSGMAAVRLHALFVKRTRGASTATKRGARVSAITTANHKTS
jgi:transcriptional regulator with XRE-family HTH domain